MSARLRMVDIEIARYKVLRKEIHTLTYKGMALSFIAELTNLNTHSISFEELVNKCNTVDHLEIDFEYSSESDFYKKFCDKKMRIANEPQSFYFFIRNKALEKIKEIEKRLNNLFALREKAKDKVPTIKNIESYTENYSLITFYIDKNKKALGEIKSFLLNEIEEKAILKCIKGHSAGVFHDFALFNPLFPHQNSWLDLTSQSILMHRYGDLEVAAAKAVFELYDRYLKNESAEYADIPLSFLETRNKFNDLLTLCNAHPLLKKRDALIKKCIILYKKREHTVIAILIPTLIEGIINDVCMMYELKKEDIYKHGFSKKINFIQSRHRSKEFGRSLYSLDYFRYFFPTIRNHMAHGWVEKSKEMEVLSGHLMLDLISACEVVMKADYKMNVHIESLKKLSSFDGEDTKLLNEYLTYLNNELLGFPYDAFYRMGNLRKKLKSLYTKKTFQNALISSITPDDLKFKELCHAVTMIQKISLKKNFPKHYNTSKELLKAIRIKFKDEKIAQTAQKDAFLKAIRENSTRDETKDMQK